jgi:UDP-N-acetylmuramate dehydrogenase
VVDPAQRTLAGYTTLRLGGPADRMVTARDPDEIAQSVREAALAGEPALILGGGSNVVVADQGFAGVVILVRSRGIRVLARDQAAVTVRVEAGEEWSEVVDAAVAAGWSGLECLAGIPGLAGATPIQNVGAYGQEVAEAITAVHVWDRRDGRAATLPPARCGFGYRASAFKRSDRWVVLAVEFRLATSASSAPVRYAELAAALGVALGDRAPLAAVRDAVLGLRAGKGMLLDPDDPDTYSAGSFFTNPVLDPAGWARLRERCAGLGEPPRWPGGGGTTKTSAAWLIERAGYGRGYGDGAVAISSKHTLALTNRGQGTSRALLALAGEIRDGVSRRFGVVLEPEPVLVPPAAMPPPAAVMG